MNRRVLFAAGLVIAATLAGCGPLRPQNKLEYLQGELSGRQEVPPVSTSGSGTVEVRLNENTQAIRWKVVYAGLSGPLTAAHFHGPAGPGQNAGVQLPITGNLQSATLEGEARLTPQQATELMSGHWYVNLHTARHPNGEVRAQLRPRH
jgi:hypothetical protein